jgi:hypothetical protein
MVRTPQTLYESFLRVNNKKYRGWKMFRLGLETPRFVIMEIMSRNTSLSGTSIVTFLLITSAFCVSKQ